MYRPSFGNGRGFDIHLFIAKEKEPYTVFNEKAFLHTLFHAP